MSEAKANDVTLGEVCYAFGQVGKIARTLKDNGLDDQRVWFLIEDAVRNIKHAGIDAVVRQTEGGDPS
jgi:hypothetical protein